MERVTIIGLGLIGGSLGLALKKAKVSGLEVVGYNRGPRACLKARKIGAVDKIVWNLGGAVKQSSLVVIAVPVVAVKDIMEAIAPHLPAGCVVTDTSSTKAQVMEWARDILPSSVHFVGGHPMAGKETPGIDGADAELFQDATYCLVPSVTAPSEAVDAVVELAQIVGAKHLFVDATEHDGFVAAISHLPLLMSAALVSLTTNSQSWREMARLASSGYRDVTRLASGDSTMGHDMCVTNKENIGRWIDALTEELGRFKTLMNEDGEQFRIELARAQLARDKWLAGKQTSELDAAVKVHGGTGETLMSFLVGQRLARAMQGPKADDRSRRK
ncbi:MAG: prephenate dehydrogenase [Chloroflexi bacterium]|nr:prephenate dehydrogenase [Chloroflexota bacterium]